MTGTRISSGTVHTLPADLKKALSVKPKALKAWEDITPLARNEWICWTTSVKREETRKEHICRTVEHLLEGKRRPCCWAGCMHRKDKAPNASQKYVQAKRKT